MQNKIITNKESKSNENKNKTLKNNREKPISSKLLRKTVKNIRSGYNGTNSTDCPFFMD